MAWSKPLLAPEQLDPFEIRWRLETTGNGFVMHLEQPHHYVRMRYSSRERGTLRLVMMLDAANDIEAVVCAACLMAMRRVYADVAWTG